MVREERLGPGIDGKMKSLWVSGHPRAAALAPYPFQHPLQSTVSTADVMLLDGQSLQSCRGDSVTSVVVIGTMLL